MTIFSIRRVCVFAIGAVVAFPVLWSTSRPVLFLLRCIIKCETCVRLHLRIFHGNFFHHVVELCTSPSELIKIEITGSHCRQRRIALLSSSCSLQESTPQADSSRLPVLAMLGLTGCCFPNPPRNSTPHSTHACSSAHVRYQCPRGFCGFRETDCSLAFTCFRPPNHALNPKRSNAPTL